MGYDEARAGTATRKLIAAISEDPDRKGLCDTPTRVAKTWEEILDGLGKDPYDYLCTQFGVGTDELVLVRDTVFHSMYEYHLLPFYGRAHVGYIPRDGRIMGSSKLVRTVEGYSRHPQVQRQPTAQITDAINGVLHPQDIIVTIEAEHMCMSMRDVSKPGSSTITSALQGIMNDGAARAEMMSLVLDGQR